MNLKNIIRILFLVAFMSLSYYIIKIKTQKYESNTIVTIKDLSKKQSVSSIGSMILGQGDINVKQNLELLSVYIRSHDMFEKINKDFNLTKYYQSEIIDPVNRLYEKKEFPYNLTIFRLNKDNLLKKYNNDLEIYYDDLSATLKISFFHSNSKIAKNIVEKIVSYSSYKINSIEKENAIILSKFLKQQEEEYRNKYISTIKKIINYQNKVGLIDPDIDIKSKSELLANLESQLIQKEVEYQAKLIKYTPQSRVIKTLKIQIDKIKLKIKKIKSSLTGKSRKKENLNRDKFTFELLRNELLLNQELYKQSLLKLEDAKISVNQNSKNLIVITKANLSELYSKPNKVRDIITLFIILFFLYGVLKTSYSILKEHKD